MTDAHSARSHARLSPSAAHRWMHCPGAPAMESRFPSTSSAAANEGTAAHELAAWALTMDRDPADMLGRVIDINGTDHFSRFLAAGSPLGEDSTRWPVTEEMVEAVSIYVDTVRALGGERAIEERVEVPAISHDLFGTCDAIVIRDGEVHIVDLKYGRGVAVSAEANPQLICYAEGARARYHNKGPFETVKATIVQPRLNPKPDTWSADISTFETHVRQIAEAARLATAAQESFFANPQTPALKASMERWYAENLSAGDWCRFCAAGATCPARAEKAIADAQAEFADDGAMTLPEPSAMAPEQLAATLTRARAIQHWINAVEEYAHAEAMAGRVPPGFKLAAKRSSRNWRDEAAFLAAAPFMLSIGETELYAPPKLLSPAQLEKKLPKAERDAMAAFVVKESSGFNLVPVDDARPNARPSAEEEFN